MISCKWYKVGETFRKEELWEWTQWCHCINSCLNSKIIRYWALIYRRKWWEVTLCTKDKVKMEEKCKKEVVRMCKWINHLIKATKTWRNRREMNGKMKCRIQPVKQILKMNTTMSMMMTIQTKCKKVKLV
jgi:hypothetical protein